MNQDIKERWLAALRSGEFQQGTLALKRGDKYCCLGVLCELAVEEGVAIRMATTPSGDEYVDKEYGMARTQELPAGVAKWAGLDSSNPRIPVKTRYQPALGINTERETLADLNDSGLTFPQIADVIERFL